MDFEGCPDGFELLGGTTLWQFPHVKAEPCFCDCESFLHHRNNPCGHIKAAFPLYLRDQGFDPEFRKRIQHEFNLHGNAYAAVKMAFAAMAAEKCQTEVKPKPKRKYVLK